MRYLCVLKNYDYDYVRGIIFYYLLSLIAYVIIPLRFLKLSELLSWFDCGQQKIKFSIKILHWHVVRLESL